MGQLIIPNEVFFVHIKGEINAGNSVRIPVKGNSMLPLIHPETDEIELSPLDKRSLRKGNIVLALLEDGRYLVHRIEKVKDGEVFIRGDGNASARETCTVDHVFAQVTGIFRKGKKSKKTVSNGSSHNTAGRLPLCCGGFVWAYSEGSIVYTKE